ncbi:hypothetical protein [Desulfovibrio cuneatus]|uniref:hypothetical protein n=1 Tax=Desulfovibrio cuneatus TaxID=159728 RepID=UPI00041CCA44|nr:hypothetical protein [Desulfovibrio cuneatus]
MALNSVTLMELLRPWRGAGITHLLALPEPGDPTPEELEAQEQPQALEAGPAGHLVPAAGPVSPVGIEHTPPGLAPTSPTPSPPANAKEGRPIPSHLLPPQPASRGQQPQGHGASSRLNAPGQVEATPDTAHPAAQALPAPNTELHTWPESWQALWQRTRPASIVWSYPALSQDLAGQGSPERSQLMRGLIGSLALPKGSSAFWPLTAHQDSGTCHMPAAFAGAITRLAPQVVVFMGASALPLSGFALTLSFPFTQQVLGGKMFLLLPETETLIADAAAKARAAAFLRAQFASIPSLFFTKG